MKKKLEQFIPYFLTVIAISFPWFLKPGYLFFTDFVWGPHTNIAWYENWYLVQAISKILSPFMSAELFQKLFIGIVFLIILLGARKLVTELFLLGQEGVDLKNESFLVFIVSLFVLFNPFVYDRVLYGQFGVVLALGFFCSAIGYYFEYIRTKNNIKIVSFGINAGFMILFSMHFIFFCALVVSVLTISFIKTKISWRAYIYSLFIALAVVFVINSNWIIGFVFQKTELTNIVNNGITSADAYVFPTSGENDIDVIANVTMMSGFWGKDQYRYYDLVKIKENWGRSFFILLPIILLGLYLSLKEKRTRNLSLGLLILFFLSVILAIGIRLPLAREITQFLYDYLPFYTALREPQKWVAVIVLIYTIYLGLGLKYIINHIFLKNYKVLVLLFFGAVIIMQAPLLLFGFKNQIKATPYPDDWYEVNLLIKKDQGDSCKEKTLFLPWHLYMGFSWTKNVIKFPAQEFFECGVIQGTNIEWGGIYDNSGDPTGKKVSEWINAKGDTGLLKIEEIGLRYIVLVKEVDWEDYSWISELSNIQILKETQGLIVYKIYE